MSLFYIYMVSSYVIPRLCYSELLCNLQTCAKVSSCLITKLACMQICAMVSGELMCNCQNGRDAHML